MIKHLSTDTERVDHTYLFLRLIAENIDWRRDCLMGDATLNRNNSSQGDATITLNRNNSSQLEVTIDNEVYICNLIAYTTNTSYITTATTSSSLHLIQQQYTLPHIIES
jgi:cAMP phosphodiesterase